MLNELSHSLLEWKWAPDPSPTPISIIVTLVTLSIAVATWNSWNAKSDKLPTANPSTFWTNTETIVSHSSRPVKRLKCVRVNHVLQKAFVTSGKELLDQARLRFPGVPYRMITDLGNVVVLPPELGDEVRNKPQLSFIATILEVRDEDFERSCSEADLPTGSSRPHPRIRRRQRRRPR